MNDKRKLRIIIIVLAILNILVLTLFLFVKCKPDSNGVSVDVIPNNTVYESNVSQIEESTESSESKPTTSRSQNSSSLNYSGSASSGSSSRTATTVVTREENALTLTLKADSTYIKAQPFNVSNMFPGDTVTQKYKLLAEYYYDNTSKPTLYFYCNPHSDSDTVLADGLIITLEMNDTVLWKGKASEISGEKNALSQKLSAFSSRKGNHSDTWNVAITAELPTSAGNEYQSKRIVLDFVWVLEGSDYIESKTVKEIDPVVPYTGDSTSLVLWIAVFVITLMLMGILIFILLKKRKEGADKHGNFNY